MKKVRIYEVLGKREVKGERAGDGGREIVRAIQQCNHQQPKKFQICKVLRGIFYKCNTPIPGIFTHLQTHLFRNLLLRFQSGREGFNNL